MCSCKNAFRTGAFATAQAARHSMLAHRVRAFCRLWSVMMMGIRIIVMLMTKKLTPKRTNSWSFRNIGRRALKSSGRGRRINGMSVAILNAPIVTS